MYAIFDKAQLRNGLEANRLSITPLMAEPIYTSDTKRLYIGDGVTPGGNPLTAEPTGLVLEYDIMDMMMDNVEYPSISLWKELVRVINFSGSANSTIWFDFTIPSYWKNSKNIIPEIYYILPQNDPLKTIKLEFSYYVISTASAPNISTPTQTYEYYLNSADLNNTDKYLFISLSTFIISSTHITQPNSLYVVCKLRRIATDPNDTYTGDLLLSKLRLKQVD